MALAVSTDVGWNLFKGTMLPTSTLGSEDPIRQPADARSSAMSSSYNPQSPKYSPQAPDHRAECATTFLSALELAAAFAVQSMLWGVLFAPKERPAHRRGSRDEGAYENRGPPK